jgi:GT2 family glycosyltransferase
MRRQKMPIKIDIGCGRSPRPGFTGLDIESQGQKYVRDVMRGLPFADNTVSEINLMHVLEHIHGGDDMLFFISELYRVCRHDGRIHIRTPHSSTNAAHDPTHLSFWNEESLCYFTPKQFPNLAIPSSYKWNFKFSCIERNDNELKVELIVDKPTVIDEVHNSKTSIIVVAYNQLEYTKKCIESILTWTKGVEYEIILVDNNSDDGTEEYASRLSQQDPRLKYFNTEENLGWVKGINYGLQQISDNSNFVILSNNDIAITGDGWLTRMLEHFTPLVGAVGPTSNYVIGRQSTQFNHNGVHEELTNVLIGFFMCIRRSVIDEIGPMDEIFGMGGADDYDYSVRIQEAGYQLMIARDVYIHHYGSRSFMPALDNSMENYNDYWKAANDTFVEKWGEKKLGGLFASPIHVACCIPMRTDYLHRMFAMRFAQMEKPFGWSLIDAPRGLIHDSRNMLVRKALEFGATHILMIDDDMIPSTDLFVKLYNADVPVISALAFKRRAPYEPCIYRWGFDPSTGAMAVIPDVAMIKHGVRQVDATGFGAVLIKAEVFRTIPDPWFELNQFGEDLDFCLKCNKYDIPIYCDTDTIIGHIGDNELVYEDKFFEARDKGQIGSMIIESNSVEKIKRILV